VGQRASELTLTPLSNGAAQADREVVGELVRPKHQDVWVFRNASLNGGHGEVDPGFWTGLGGARMPFRFDKRSGP